MTMKTNQEIAASVFEKSRIVLQKRAVRRKRIAAASATLGVAAVVTVTALMGKGAFTHGNIPTSDPSTVPSNAESRLTDFDTEIDTSFTSSKNSASETASSESGGSSKTSSSENTASETTSSKAASSKTVSSKTTSSVSSSSEDESKNDTISGTTSSKSATSKTTSSKTTSSKTTSSKVTSSKVTSSKVTSSKTTSSKTTSSKTTSSKNTSSKTTSSKTTSSKTTSSKNTSSKNTSSKNTSSKPDSRPATDIDAVTDADTDGWYIEPDTDSPPPWYHDTDQEQPDHPSITYCSVYYTRAIDIDVEEQSFAEILAENAELIVIAKVDSISFEADNDKTDDMSSDFFIPSEDCAMLCTDVHLNVSEVLKGKCGSELDLTMFGGIADPSYKNEQKSVMEENKYIPIVESRADPEQDKEYVFILDYNYNCSCWTLFDYSSSILPTDDQSGRVTADDIINIFR